MALFIDLLVHAYCRVVYGQWHQSFMDHDFYKNLLDWANIISLIVMTPFFLVLIVMALTRSDVRSRPTHVELPPPVKVSVEFVRKLLTGGSK
jgi:hypothetical protein